jgi:ubiquinone/menaquinone biosynthesis C-methylase UbiE
MPEVNNTENVLKQFATDKKLTTRISFYTKYSENPYPFTDWLFDKYKFKEGDSILELGCGSGSHWEGKIEKLPKRCRLVLSDFSNGMVDTVKERYSGTFANVDCENIDIQNIPFDKNMFDLIIANHMLMHVPDLNKGLGEVRRVLKDDGIFYSATDGDGGMRPFFHNIIKQFNPRTTAFSEKLPFSLQNGKELLCNHFGDVKRIDYQGDLSVTNTKDLIDWLKSTVLISGYSEENLAELYRYFEELRQKQGAIKIHKETGIFISKGDKVCEK